MKISIKPILKKNYLHFIDASVNSTQFRNLFCKINNKTIDITKDGAFSCAYFVSSVLKTFDLIDNIHSTVSGTVRILRKYGWKRIMKPKVGCLLIWEEKEENGSTNEHIGFYTSSNTAISNDPKKKSPQKHHYTFGKDNNKPKRKITEMYWNKKLD